MDGIHFCPECGASIEGNRKTCPNCGALLDKGSSMQGQGNIPPNGNNMQTPFSQPGFNQFPNNAMQYESYNQYSQNDGASNGCAITGLILGILSILVCCFSWFDAILGIAGIILSSLGVKSYKYKGCAIAGLVCSIAGTLLAIWFTVLIYID